MLKGNFFVLNLSLVKNFTRNNHENGSSDVPYETCDPDNIKETSKNLLRRENQLF